MGKKKLSLTTQIVLIVTILVLGVNVILGLVMMNNTQSVMQTLI